MSNRRKYDQESRERAVRMYLDRLGEGDISQRAARLEVSGLLGINEQTLRGWVRSQVGQGTTSAAMESMDEENARLRKENAQLRRANEILKTASAFFASAELDRKLGPKSNMSMLIALDSGSSRSLPCLTSTVLGLPHQLITRIPPVVLDLAKLKLARRI